LSEILDDLSVWVHGHAMNRLERLYAVTDELRRRAPQAVSAAALADRFGVTRRTMERDLAALRASGVALYGTPGRTGGQALAGPTGRVVFSLSAEEATALLLAATATAGMPYSDAGRSAARRLLDALPAATQAGVEELRLRLRTATDEAPRPARRIRRTVEEAVRRRVVVNLTYSDRHQLVTHRAVEAVGFYGGSDGWYLIGWCRLRDAGRIFRLDRITAAHLTRQRAPDRDLDETLGWVPERLVTPS
jgi:predicted DNA-binding transcriptional regulator YafY